MINVKYDKILGDLRENDNPYKNQILRDTYFYFSQSYLIDTIGDWRMYGDDDGFYIQYCTVGNETKGGGTWITKFTTQV